MLQIANKRVQILIKEARNVTKKTSPMPAKISNVGVSGVSPFSALILTVSNIFGMWLGVFIKPITKARSWVFEVTCNVGTRISYANLRGVTNQRHQADTGVL